MPNLSTIVDNINTSLQLGNFKSQKFQAAQYYNISDPIRTTGESSEINQPMLLDEFGEGISLVFDDTNSFQIFHTVDNLQYQIPDNEDFGKPGHVMQEVAELTMVFAGSRSRLQVRPEDVAAAIMYDIPKEFTPAFCTSIEMLGIYIETGEVETNPYTIFEQTWQGVKYSLNTDTMLVSVKYKIVGTYSQCFDLCN